MWLSHLLTPGLSCCIVVRVNEDPRIGFLCADVVRLCEGLDGLAPAQRLRLAVQLRDRLDAVVDAAVVESMAAAAAEGWGLRRVARFAGVSHEQVRRRLAGREGAGQDAVSG